MQKINYLLLSVLFMSALSCRQPDEIRRLTPAEENQQIDDYIAANKLTVKETLPSGLRFVLLKANPTGAVVQSGNEVSVDYRGTFLNDQVFDSGAFSYQVGTTVIEGFNQAVLKLKVGEKGKFLMPSAIAYGSRGSGSIPANTPLIFEIEVKSAK